MIASKDSMANSIARTSLAFYIRDELRAVMRLVVAAQFECDSRAGQDAMQDSPIPPGYWREIYFIVERQHGSSEEGRT
jgi:hypothetical protein